jgi:hypothetical protein
VDSIETVSGLQSVFEAAAHAVAAGRGEGLLVGGVPASAVLASGHLLPDKLALHSLHSPTRYMYINDPEN